MVKLLVRGTWLQEQIAAGFPKYKIAEIGPRAPVAFGTHVVENAGQFRDSGQFGANRMTASTSDECQFRCIC